jgi:sugar phosphate isomerase/epimerase
MRIAISNIAWDVSDDESIAELLNKHEIDAIDVAPGKYFSNISTASTSEIDRVRKWWLAKGISITGMQALLYGTTGMNMFGDHDTQEAMLTHLASTARICAGLGAVPLVFGSPKNRDRSHLSNDQTHTVAIDFFRRLGNIADQYQVKFCLEPNPTCYGANFMTTSAETAQIVMDVDHPAIQMQLDTGAITINKENSEQIISEFGSLIGHVHLSEPNLVVLGDSDTDHESMAEAIKKLSDIQTVTIEMLTTVKEPKLPAIERALKFVVRHYRNS